MRSKLRTTVVLAGCVGVLVGVLAVAAPATGSATHKIHVSCKSMSYNIDYPKLSGRSFGNLSCNEPFGAGVQRAHSSSSIVGSTVYVTGTFTNYFNAGTNHGTVKMSGPVTSGAISLKGTATITGGTGAYRNVRGRGRVSCTTADAAKTYRCTVAGPATT